MPEITSGLPHGTQNYLRVAPRVPRDAELPQGCPRDPLRPTVTSGLPSRFPRVTPPRSPPGNLTAAPTHGHLRALPTLSNPPLAHSPAAAGCGPGAHGAAGGPAPGGPAATHRACADAPPRAQARRHLPSAHAR